jgi:UDP-glucose 4-epimerase
MICVTGASGFLGQAVCNELVRRNISFEKLSRSKNQAINSPSEKICIHLAGPSSAAIVEQDPKGRTDEALDLLQYVLDHGFKKIVFASSSLVYDFRAGHRWRESDEPAPQTEYGKLKLRLENQLRSTDVSARLANLYGPGIAVANVFSDIIRQLPSPEPIQLRNLDSVRDFLYVGDAAQALIELSLKDIQGTFNVGTGQGKTIRDLVAALLQVSGTPVKKSLATHPGTPTTHLVIDPTRMNQMTSWQPSHTFEEGLKKMLGNFNS